MRVGTGLEHIAVINQGVMMSYVGEMTCFSDQLYVFISRVILLWLSWSFINCSIWNIWQNFKSVTLKKTELWRHNIYDVTSKIYDVKTDGMVMKLHNLHFHIVAMPFAKFHQFPIATFWFVKMPSFKSRQIPMTSSAFVDDILLMAKQEN